MLDPMDFKELDRITDALRQWFVSHEINDEREWMCITARLIAHSIHKAAPKPSTAPHDILTKKIDFMTAIETIAAIKYYEDQCNLIKKFIMSDLQQLNGWGKPATEVKPHD